MSITADSIQLFVQNRHSVSIRNQQNRFGSGAPNPAGEADGATSDPLVDWDRVRYTVPVFLPLDAFGVLIRGGPKT